MSIQDIMQHANAQRTEAKALLGQITVDQAVADRIVDCIIGATVLEVTAMMRDAMRDAAK